MVGIEGELSRAVIYIETDLEKLTLGTNVYSSSIPVGLSPASVQSSPVQRLSSPD